MEFLANLTQMLSQPVIRLGESTLTWWSLIYMAVLTTILLIVTGRLQRLIIRQAKSKTNLDVGITYGISSIARYALTGIGFLIILQSAGVDLSSLTIMAGAVGLGLTVGFQAFTANIMSGLTLYTEKPVKVGDRVEVDGVLGDITNITLRATTILTDDNIEIIVPNSRFITGKVTNWSHSSLDIRLGLPFKISYHSDPIVVKRIIETEALKHKGVLKEPRPELIFIGFGESSLSFELWVWTSEFTRRPLVLKSELYYEIFEKLKEESIEIPYPKHDINITSSSVLKEVEALVSK